MVKIIHYNTLIMQFPSFSCYLFSLSFTHRYYIQQLVPNHSKTTDFPLISQPYKNRQLEFCSLTVLYKKWEGRIFLTVKSKCSI